MHGRGHGWQGVCVVGCMHGRGECMAGRHAWWQGMHGWGVCMAGDRVCMAGETATAADSTHPTGMHSFYLFGFSMFLIMKIILDQGVKFLKGAVHK